MFCFLDNTREALSGLLREGRAGSNTTADHISVLDAALAQIPDAHRYGTDILIRSDSAGCTYGFLAHIRGLREHGMNTFFSVGVAIGEPIRDAIRIAIDHPDWWVPALDTDGEVRDGAEICEITGLLPADYRANYPAGTRFIVRRDKPHPGAQLSLFDTIEGLRHQVMATDTPVGGGSLPFLEARHRGHARVEDRIRCGKDTGFGHFPSRVFAINAAWLELALCGIDLIAWTQHLLLDGDLAVAEPKTLRHRLLHVAARITRSGRRTRLRVAQGWPWADHLVTAFGRLAALPNPSPEPVTRTPRAPTEEPDHRVGHPPCPHCDNPASKDQTGSTNLDQQLAKDRGVHRMLDVRGGAFTGRRGSRARRPGSARASRRQP